MSCFTGCINLKDLNDETGQGHLRGRGSISNIIHMEWNIAVIEICQLEKFLIFLFLFSTFFHQFPLHKRNQEERLNFRFIKFKRMFNYQLILKFTSKLENLKFKDMEPNLVYNSMIVKFFVQGITRIKLRGFSLQI